MAAVQPAEEPKLAAGAVSLVGQLFQSITHMAPAAGIVFSAQYMATKGGAVLPLAWLLAAVACMLTAFCLKEVVRKVRSAGGYFVIHSVALGHLVGFTTSWMWFLDEPLNAVGIGLIFPAFLSDFVNQTFGADIPWWAFSFIFILGMLAICY